MKPSTPCWAAAVNLLPPELPNRRQLAAALAADKSGGCEVFRPCRKRHALIYPPGCIVGQRVVLHGEVVPHSHVVFLPVMTNVELRHPDPTEEELQDGI